MRNALLRTTLTWLVAVMAHPAEAVECLYRAVVPDTRVVSDSGVIYDPREWTTDPRCEKLVVVMGRVRVVRHEIDEPIVRTEIGPRARLASGTVQGGDAILEQLKLIVAGDQHLRDGRVRNATDTLDAVAATLPTGRVVRAPFDTALPVLPGELDGTFTLARDSGATVMTSALKNARVTIPEASLQVDQRYQWRLQSGGQTLKGSFLVVEAATRDRALNDARGAAARDASDDPLLFDARTLHELGYATDARKRMREWLEQ